MSGLGWFIVGVVSTYVFWFATIGLYVKLFTRRNTTVDVRKDERVEDET